MEKGYPFPSSIPSTDDISPSFFLKVKSFFDHPFDFVDSLDLKIKNVEINVLRKDRGLRRIIFLFSWLIFVMWMFLGWDSCQSQFEFVIVAIPDFILGKLSFDDLSVIYAEQYGKGMHYSAWVIYGLMYWGLSKYYDEELGLRGSRNVSLAMSFTLLSIAFFETFWHYSFAIFQGQTWIITWQFPQFKILFQNISFFVLGFLMILLFSLNEKRCYSLPGKWKVYEKLKPFKFPYPAIRGESLDILPKTNFPQLRFSFNRWTLLFLILSLTSIYVWYNYGDFFPVETLRVDVVGFGVWESSPNFPQTVYTIETDLTDNINAGDQFFVENDLLHGVNTLCKVFLTFLSYSIGRVKRVENQ